jgi:hypothetical protein
MNNTERQAHWQNVYSTKAEKEVSWFQENPAPSLELIAATGISTDAAHHRRRGRGFTAS